MNEKKRPNIIIFNPDEMRWNAMGHMGNQAASTPCLDRMAAEDAVSFSNAFCQNPVCVPSRCSFTTGLYPHVHGHRTMNFLQQEGESNLFSELRDAGYYVWMNSRNDLVAGEIPGLAESQADEVYYYDKSEPVTPAPMEVLQKMFAGKAGKKEEYPYSHFKGVSEREMGYDSRDVMAAIKRIENPVSDKPLCMFIGLVNPHPPYVTTREYYDRIDPSKMGPRPTAAQTSKKSRIMDEIRKYSGLEEWSEEQWDEMRRVYLAQCAFIDDLFGQVCDALKRAGIYDDSAIFFLSDHGDFAGNYDLPEKAQNTFEHCLVKVPLLVKPPKGEPLDPGISDSLTELVDFYATAMDYAGVAPDHDHFGQSLRPVIEDRSKANRSYVFSEGGRLPLEVQCDEYHESGEQGTDPGSEYWARMMAQNDPLAHEKGTMIFDGRYKYVERQSGLNEFYDLEEDPYELKNLYDERETSSEVLRLRLEMLRWYQRSCDIVPRRLDSRFTRERVWASVRGICPPELESAVRDYIAEGHDIMASIRYCVGLRMKQNL